MTLEEVVYQINGTLGTKTEDGVFTISLFDNVADIVVVTLMDETQTLALAKGDTYGKVRHDLVNLLRGSVLVYGSIVSGSLLGVARFSSLRVPKTLTV